MNTVGQKRKRDEETIESGAKRLHSIMIPTPLEENREPSQTLNVQPQQHRPVPFSPGGSAFVGINQSNLDSRLPVAYQLDTLTRFRPTQQQLQQDNFGFSSPPKPEYFASTARENPPLISPTTRGRMLNVESTLVAGTDITNTSGIHNLLSIVDVRDGLQTEKPANDPISSKYLENLISNEYLNLLRNMETELKHIRTQIISRQIDQLSDHLSKLKQEINKYSHEFEVLQSTQLLKPADFENLLSLEEFLHTTLVPQLSLYEMDYAVLQSGGMHSTSDVAVVLSIVSQENAGPISKEKAIGPFTLRLLTGASITQIQSGPVQPELVESSQRVKRHNSDLENAKQNFQENGTATFPDLKFSSGTFPHLVRLKFRVTIQLTLDGKRITKTIESGLTKPFISMTNTGSQWKDSAGSWLKEECFKDSFEIPMPRFWNFFQRHYLHSTKQDLNTMKRPLHLKDFEYMLRARLKVGLEKPTINQKEFTKFWDWIGPGLKKIRYQKHMLWLFENGYLAAFVTSDEANEKLQNEVPGTFLIRLSERSEGEFVISYVHGTGIRHYLIQPDDTADKKKTLIDFLGSQKIFIYLLQLVTEPTGERNWYRLNKDQIFQKFYKKSAKQIQTKAAVSNAYDTRLPYDLHE